MPGDRKVKELNSLMKNRDKYIKEGIMVLNPGDNLNKWRGFIKGPDDSPYEGGIFELQIKFSQDYPFSAPIITFVTPIYHMNVNSSGEICIDILKESWTPALKIDKVLHSLRSFLNQPNPDDPYVTEIANLYRSNKKTYEKKVREYTSQKALKDFPEE
uniref:E2 ubiquitin-conjugating enzyme n=1 Tax=viral metagenome TaxID=1070528 RepID=A0A6C0ACT3_9ZZZZ